MIQHPLRDSTNSSWSVPMALQRWIVRAKLAKQTLIPRGERFIEPMLCNGYEYEAQEVNRCLVEGHRESPLMPLGESREVTETLERFVDCIEPTAGAQIRDEMSGMVPLPHFHRLLFTWPIPRSITVSQESSCVTSSPRNIHCPSCCRSNPFSR